MASECLTLFFVLLLLQYDKFQAQTGDSAVLLDFKKSITEDPNGVLDNWSSNIPFCNWTGVTCHPKYPQSVESLDLPNHRLSGTLTSSFGRLLHLRYLDLQFNNFTGTIPTAFGNCTSLEVFALGSNALTGAIPDMFQNLQRLSILYFWSNSLQGSIPFSIGNCSRLTELALYDNALTGTIPSSFVLPRLELFSVWGNNRLQGGIPQWLTNCTNLDSLYLNRNNFSGRIPPSLGIAQNKLKYVLLHSNNFQGPIPLSIANCSSLERLYLANNSLTGSIPPQIGNLHLLQHLYLASNHLTGNIPESFGNLSSITDLILYSAELNGSIPATMGSLRNIQRLNLEVNHLSGGIPASLVGCRHLGFLGLGWNKLEGDIPPQLGQIQSLTKLFLRGNRLSGEIPSSIGNLSRLQYLDLSENNLNGILPDSLANLGNSLVFTFDVSFNNLQGGIPPWFGAFGKVQDISLASNNFTGEIPTAIKRCKGLVRLNVSSNGLTGQIPPELGELQSLQHLDLSVNVLTGPIPPSLTNLTGLLTLNLSMNSLQGQIPGGGAFSKFNSSSFLGNPLLCGAVLNIVCPTVIYRHYHNHSTLQLLKWLVPLVVVVTGFTAYMTMVVVLRSFNTNEIEILLDGGPLKLFTPQQLLDMTNQFDDANVVGEGGYSKVFKALWDGKTVAVKVMKEKNSEVNKSFLCEAKTLTKLRHRNIVRVLGYCCRDNMLALVMEYMSNGSLANHVVPDLESKLNIAVDVAQAVHYIHHEFDNPIVHCDLKPGNVLLDSDLNARITDFGISKPVYRSNNTVSISNFKGTIGYAPPEYAHSAIASTMGDVYSYGMLLLVMITGKSPTEEMFQQIGSCLRDWVLDNIATQGDGILKSLMQIGLLCTITNPNSRPTMKEVLAMLLELKHHNKKITLPSLEALANTSTSVLTQNGSAGSSS